MRGRWRKVAPTFSRSGFRNSLRSLRTDSLSMRASIHIYSSALRQRSSRCHAPALGSAGDLSSRHLDSRAPQNLGRVGVAVLSATLVVLGSLTAGQLPASASTSFVPVYPATTGCSGPLNLGYTASGTINQPYSGCGQTPPFVSLGTDASVTYTFTVPNDAQETLRYGIPAGGFPNDAAATISVDGSKSVKVASHLGVYGSSPPTPTSLILWTSPALGSGRHMWTIRAHGLGVNVYGLWKAISTVPVLVVNGFSVTASKDPYSTAVRHVLSKLPAHSVIPSPARPACVITAVSANEVLRSRGLQIVWNIAPTQHYLAESPSARLVSVKTVVGNLTGLLQHIRQLYLATLYGERVPPKGNGDVSSWWAVRVQSVSTTGALMYFQVAASGATTTSTWANVYGVKGAASQANATDALAHLLYYSKAVASGTGSHD